MDFEDFRSNLTTTVAFGVPGNARAFNNNVLELLRSQRARKRLVRNTRTGGRLPGTCLIRFNERELVVLSDIRVRDAVGPRLITRAVDAVCVLRFEITYLRNTRLTTAPRRADTIQERARNAEFKGLYNTLTAYDARFQRKLAYQPTRSTAVTNGAIFYPYIVRIFRYGFQSVFLFFFFFSNFRRSASNDTCITYAVRCVLCTAIAS